jgi:uncharacterized protein (DUF2062 family)
LVTETPTSYAAAMPRTPWQRHVIDPIAVQLTQGITPEKVALTLAVGSALALFPILGTTTLLCLAAGILLRLNQPIIQMVNALCTPLHLPVIYLMVRLGNWLFNVPYSHLGIRMMNHMLWDDPKEFFEKFGLTALHAIIAWMVIAPLWVLLVFVFALPVLREALRRRSGVVCETTAAPPPEHPVP